MKSQKEPFKRTKVTQSGLDILVIEDNKSYDMLKIIPSQKKIYYLSAGVVKRLRNLKKTIELKGFYAKKVRKAMGK